MNTYSVFQYLLFAVAAAASVAATAYSQEPSRSEVCPVTELRKNEIVAICTREIAMATLVRPRLLFRLRSNGVGEYEAVQDGKLVLKSMQLTNDELRFMNNLLALPELQKSEGDYPKPLTYRYADPSTQTTFSFLSKSGTRNILLRGFAFDDGDLAPRYPGAIVFLISNLLSYRDRAEGIKYREFAKMSFCSMLNADRANGRDVEVYADFSHHGIVLASGKVVDERDVLYEAGCGTSTLVTVNYQGEPSDIDAMKNMLGRASSERFGGKARVLVRGRYEVKAEQPSRRTVRIFHLKQVLLVEPVDLPFKGELEIGWNYVDTLDRSTAEAPVGLSLPIRHPNPNHTALVEWTNPEMFLRVLKRGHTTVVFRVTGSTTRLAAPGRWTETFDCKILEVK